MHNDKSVGFPALNYKEEDVATRPVPLHEIPMQARVDREMAVVNQYHERIGKAISVFWGHADCLEYLQKLVMSGGDGLGKTRVGFRADVLAALISLVSLHEENFPSIRTAKKGKPGVF